MGDARKAGREVCTGNPGDFDSGRCCSDLTHPPDRRAVTRVRARARIWVLSLGLLMLQSCAGWRAGYLSGAVDQATRQDVIARLGSPAFTEDLVDGGTAWIYVIGPPKECEKSILVFDRDHILRNWRQEESC